jgi:SAM-dependent methyltransferase
MTHVHPAPQRRPIQYDSYRDSHTRPGYGDYYNRAYGRGYYRATWSDIEIPLLRPILAQLGGADHSCLDFACGTGRVTSEAARHFGRVVGVDVSPEMLSSAEVPESVELRRIDLTRRSLGETFDVATAFRFFLNAEESLRSEALRAIHRHLKDDGHLVCNIHMNATSPAGLACRTANRIPVLTFRCVSDVATFIGELARAGFVVEDLVHYGYLPGPWGLPPRLAEALVAPVERLAHRVHIPQRFAQNFLVVARKK